MPLSVIRKNNLTAQDAYSIIHEKYPTEKVRSCLEYDDFFLFVMAPLYVLDSESYCPGTVFDAVDKRTGRMFEYDITTDIDAYDRAANVKIDTFFSKAVRNL